MFVSKSLDFSDAQESMRRLAYAAQSEPVFAELRVQSTAPSRTFIAIALAAHLVLSVVALKFLI